MDKIEISELIRQTNEANNWVPKKLFLQMTARQEFALEYGYQPHWDMRYGIQFEDGYFYNYRSGWIVNKFKIEKIENDLFQVTEMYDNPEKSDWEVVFDSLVEACRQNDVDFDGKQIKKMIDKTMEMQINQ